MAQVALTPTWIKIVPEGEEYLLQTSSGSGITVRNSVDAPLNNTGFFVDINDVISSTIYPATSGIWARSVGKNAVLTVDTWV